LNPGLSEKMGKGGDDLEILLDLLRKLSDLPVFSATRLWKPLWRLLGVSMQRWGVVVQAWRTRHGRWHRSGLRQNTLALYGAQGLGRWLGRGFWAVMDQGLFATSNFVLNMLLARWLTLQDYGAFTIAFAVFLFFGTFHTALLTEPMLIFGPGRHRGHLSEYLDVLLYAHLGFTALSSPVLLLASLGFGLSGSRAFALVLLGVALAGPFILFLWLMRQACYVRLEPHLAASGGVLYLALILAGLYVLYQREWLSPVSALGVMGFSSLAAGLWLAGHLHLGRSPLVSHRLVREALRDHWGYGRWATATEALTWIPNNVYYLFLPAWGGLEATAALKALWNLTMPILHANAALSVLLVPTLTRVRRDGRFRHLVRLALVLFTAGPVLYWVLLGLFHHQLVTWLYGEQYRGYENLLWLLGFSPLITGSVKVLGAALRALERPDRLFWAFLLSTVVTLTLGLGCMAAWGIVGVGVGSVLSEAAKALAMWAYYRRLGKAHFSEES
jgi:O-antigen/teichoic acid export membrane protein